MDWSLLPYVIAAIAGVAFFEGIYFLLFDTSGRSRRMVDRRLTSTGPIPQNAGAADLLRRRPYTFGMSPWAMRLFSTSPVRWFDDLVMSSGISGSPDRTMLQMMIATVSVAAALSVFLGWSPLGSIPTGIGVGVVVPIWILRMARRRRLERITAQLPDALDMLVRSLRAGHPVSTGIGMIAEEMPDPIGREFAIVFDEMSYGLDLREALEKLGDRLGHYVIDYLIVAMRVQYGTGGNLAEILNSLSDVLRERLKLQSKVKALSAEARLSGKILSGLPVVIVIALIFINPHYYDAAWTNKTLAAVLIGAAAALVSGIFLLNRFVKNIR
jgi:tight adherence protein B